MNHAAADMNDHIYTAQMEPKAANLWLIAFAVYYAFGLVLGFISALIDRRFDRGSERRVGIIELGVFLPIVLPALAVGWVLEKVLLVLVGYPILGLIWLWHKIFKSER